MVRVEGGEQELPSDNGNVVIKLEGLPVLLMRKWIDCFMLVLNELIDTCIGGATLIAQNLQTFMNCKAGRMNDE